MRPTTTICITLFLALTHILVGCKDQSQGVGTKIPTRETKAKAIKTIPIEFRNSLRPSEGLKLGKIYKDTVDYVLFDDSYDESYFVVEKHSDTIALVSLQEQTKPLLKGDKIEIQWKIDSIRPAGDPELLDFKPFLISVHKINKQNLKRTKTKVLWRENQYDPSIEDEFSILILEETYIKNMTDPEKAALAYVGSFIGNECEWDGGANENRSNLMCKIPESLGFGYQCSDLHLDFLRKWFSKDSVALKNIERCPTIPNSATIQSTFDEIIIHTDREVNTIKVASKVLGINVRENSSRSWDRIDTFEYNSENVRLVLTEKIETNPSL